MLQYKIPLWPLYYPHNKWLSLLQCWSWICIINLFPVGKHFRQSGGQCHNMWGQKVKQYLRSFPGEMQTITKQLVPILWVSEDKPWLQIQHVHVKNFSQKYHEFVKSFMVSPKVLTFYTKLLQPLLTKTLI